jgi:hypothetical protein
MRCQRQEHIGCQVAEGGREKGGERGEQRKYQMQKPNHSLEKLKSYPNVFFESVNHLLLSPNILL